MPRPTSSTTVGRPDLAASVYEFIEKDENFIADKVMPFFAVAEASGDYPVIPVEALAETPDDLSRRPRGKYNRGDWEFEMDSYSCVENGHEEPVDDVEARLYARYFDAEKIAAIRAMGIVRRVHEKRVASMLFNTSNFSATSVTNEWDDASNATPIDDVNAGIISIRETVGIVPDTLIISMSTFFDLGLCDQIIDRIKYTNPDVRKGQLSKELLAMALNVERVEVGGGLYNASKKGQSASLSNFWSNEYAMLCVTSASPDITTPCIGRTFRWDADCPENQVVESYYEDDSRSTIIRCREHTDEEIITSGAAYLMDNITT